MTIGSVDGVVVVVTVVVVSVVVIVVASSSAVVDVELVSAWHMTLQLKPSKSKRPQIAK